MKKNSAFKTIFVCFIAALIPALLLLNGIQSRRYTKLENQVHGLEKKQRELVEKNKQLITEISILSSSDRIEKLAGDGLKMHKAESSDIVRVEVDGGKREQ
ncbi:MAG: cell division protein FtsL [Treponema sp.]|jgi:cell division protein FtsL|nr:cell division protein FtsL [Treponema sp.]